MDIKQTINLALEEDIATGDITAMLLPEDAMAHAQVVSREAAICCGQEYFNSVFETLDPSIQIFWHINEGEEMEANEIICECRGLARTLVTGERTALNFLQTLSGTATTVKRYVKAMGDTNTLLLDTRKTIPLLRNAQKYAVTCGGGENHRFGLFDRFLIKENHIAAAGSITKAIDFAREMKLEKLIEVEVENLTEYDEALKAKPDIIMLDNFSIDDIKKAVELREGECRLEVSGNITLNNIADYAKCGVDFISVGATTKHVHAIDFSMSVKTIIKKEEV